MIIHLDPLYLTGPMARVRPNDGHDGRGRDHGQEVDGKKRKGILKNRRGSSPSRSPSPPPPSPHSPDPSLDSSDELGLTDEEIDTYRQAFSLYDIDGNGQIIADEFIKVTADLGKMLTLKEVEEMILSVDQDMNGMLDFPEFLLLMSKHNSKEKTEKEAKNGTNTSLKESHGDGKKKERTDFDGEEVKQEVKESNHNHGKKSKSKHQNGRKSGLKAGPTGGGKKKVPTNSGDELDGDSDSEDKNIPESPPRTQLRPAIESQPSKPHLHPQRYDKKPLRNDRSLSSIQNVYDSSFRTLAVDLIDDSELNGSKGTFFKEIMEAEEKKLDYDWEFLEHEDDKGYTGLHKLVNGVPYDGDGHRGWKSIMAYIIHRQRDGQLILDLQEYQKKSTPMLSVCCRKPPVSIIKVFIETTRAVLTQEHGRYVGMIPLHFACKFFASRDVIALLVKERPDSIVWQDKSDRTPLHCALNNFESKLPPAYVIDLLLTATDEEGNIYTSIRKKNKNGSTPLIYFVYSTLSIDPNDPDQEEDRKNAISCVDSYFRAIDLEPATLLKELISFPKWLIGYVLKKDHVRAMLNGVTSSPFCTNYIFAHLYMRIIIIVCFWVMSLRSIEVRRLHNEPPERGGNNGEGDPKYFGADVVMLYIVISLLIIWEMAKILSHKKLKVISSYIMDPWNYLEWSCIALMMSSTIIANMGKVNNRSVWILYMFTGFTNWLHLASFLRICNRDFAVFMKSVIEIIKSLLPFFTTMLFALFAFTHVYQMNDRGINPDCYIPVNNTTEMERDSNFCTFDSSMLKVYTMFATKSMDEKEYDSPHGSTLAISVCYMFFVFILMLNAIIAIIARSYSESEKRGEDFFYQNRFFFAAIVYKIFKLRPRLCRPKNPTYIEGPDTTLQSLWDILIVAFADPTQAFVRDKKVKLDEQFKGPLKGLLLGIPKDKVSNPKRKVAFFFLIPIWVILGGVLFGRIWPPCLRQWFLCPATTSKKWRSIRIVHEKIDKVKKVKKEEGDDEDEGEDEDDSTK